MAGQYTSTSPYFLTQYSQFFLDTMVNRPIPKETDDQLWVINQTYQYRPDLLAFDLYGDSALWWVFRARNPNSIDDPVFDFDAGVTIMIPKKDGFGVLEDIKKVPRIAKIPVIVLSNLGQKIDQERALALGANEYLVKSDYPIQDIIEKVKGYLAQ